MPHRFVNSRQCAGKLRDRVTQCGKYACKDSLYCRKHGGAIVGHIMPPQTKAGISAGAKNYWARMRQALADGIISHYPNASPEALEAKRTKMKLLMADKRARGEALGPNAARKQKAEAKKAGTAPPDPMILQAERALIYEKAALPAPIDKPFEEQEDHEKLQTLTGMALDTVQEVLRLPIYEKGPDGKPVLNLKVVAIKKDTALRALAVRVKVDRNALAARRTDGTFNLLQRLLAEKKPGDDAKVIDVEPERNKA